MKKFLILAGTAALALLLTACNKEEGESVVSDNGTKSITVTVSGLNLTKSSAIATSDGVSPWGTTATVSKLQIYFTDALGVIQYYYADDSNAALASNGGIRFINLKNVSAVYVTANATTSNVSVTTGSTNISAITADLASQSPYVSSSAIDQGAILYIGGDTSLEIANDASTSYNTTIDINTGTTPASTYSGSQYYYADVNVRPVVSRLEISKIQALESGSTEAAAGSSNPTYTYGNNTYEYYISWSGFKPELRGIYMSNFYGTINPAKPSVGSFFETPEGDPINTDTSDGTYYLWGSSANIGSTYNVDGITLYADGGSSLFTASYSNPNYIYFNTTSKCVPFNFFVPFDVEATGTSILKDSDAMPDANEPKYHFLFYTGNTDMENYTCSLWLKNQTSSENVFTEYTASSAATAGLSDLFTYLTSDYALNTVGDKIYYANITSLNAVSDIKDDSGSNTYYASGAKINMQPNKIYQLSEVTIQPNHLISGTTATEEQAVIVSVTAVNYAQEAVTANFNE